MNKHYKVVWTYVAEDDLNKIIDYIVKENISNAINIFKKIKNKCLALYIYPYRGRIVPELKDCGILLYREIIIEPWRVLYRVTEDYVFITSVIDGRQNVEDILLNRFINKEL
jgi:plasmid stabilization system protein ParE